jgi:hypothetical protein
MSLLFWHLNATCADAVPPAHLEALRGGFHATALYNHFCTDELLTLLQLLEAHALPALPYKGPTLALGGYGDLALRGFSDLDLLVPAHEVPRAAHLLLAQGFRLHHALEWEACFVQETLRIPVDLHWGLTPRRFHFPLNFARLWAHRQPLCLAGTTVATLAPEDLLMVLCVEAARDAWGGLQKPREHRYGRLLTLCDIAALLQGHPALDWDRVLADTRRLGGQRMLWFGLRLARELLGTPLPPHAVPPRRPAPPALDALVAHVWAQWCQEPEERAAPALTPARVHFALRERWQDRLFPYLDAGVQLLVPSDKDRACIWLPRGLGWLYYVIRPFRAVREYGVRLFLQRLKSWLVWSN